jgi:hypothetical protein
MSTLLSPEAQIRLAVEREQEQFLVEKMWEKSAFMGKEQKQVYIKQLRQSILTGSAPKTKKEFWDCIKSLFGVEIPYALTQEATDEHPWCTPLDWMYNVWSGKWEYSFAWASRASGKTYLMAILDFMFATYKPNFEIVHCGGVKVQAAVTQKYLAQFASDPILGTVLHKKGVTKLHAEWNNHSTWQIVTGSYRSVSGQHCPLLSIDEVMLWESPEALQQTLKIPVPYENEPARWFSCSTNQRSFGPVTWLLDNAEERNIHVAKWSCFEIMQPCKTCVAIDENPYGTDVDREKTCLLWSVCYGKKGIKSRGWQPREEVIKDVIKLGGIEANEVRTQLFCLRPSSKGIVLNNFLHEPKSLGGNYCNVTYDYEHTLPFYVGADPSAGKISVLQFYHYFNGQVFMFDELIQDDCPDATTAKEKFYWYCKKNNYADPLTIIIDPRRSDAVHQWRQGTEEGEGMNHAYNALAPNIEETQGGQVIIEGILELRTSICNGANERKFFVNPDKCPRTLYAIKQHHYPTDNSNQIISDNPSPEYKDEIDAMRYFIRYVNTVLNPRGMGMLLV